MTAEIKLNYLNKRYEVTEDDLLGASYSQINNIGDRQSTSVESLVIDLTEFLTLTDYLVTHSYHPLYETI